MRLPIQPVAPSIDDPIALLLACHDKVRHFAGLTLRLRDHMVTHGPDQQAQEAARAILRYFRIAAPLHHDDEERDLFPALDQDANPALKRALHELVSEHAELASLWRGVVPWLEATQAGETAVAPDTLSSFEQRYIAHADREETEVYPAAKMLTPAVLRGLAETMVARRTSNAGLPA
jgi:hemerythrin-like domain-containing protein